MPFNDLREYIAQLEEEGEVQRIAKEADLGPELGAVIRRSYDLRAPAPLFENIRGYPATLAGSIGSRREEDSKI